MNIKASMLCGCALSEENTVVGPWRMWLLRDVFTTQPRWVGAGGRSVAPAAARLPVILAVPFAGRS